MKRATIAAVLTAAVLWVVPASAQGRMVLRGVVTDSSGAALPGAAIEVLADARVLSTVTTGSDGRYEVTVPEAGGYQLRARLNGFAESVASVDPRAGATHDFVMRIAAVADRVVVTASRIEERQADVLQSVSVFDAAEIAALGASSVADVLRMVLGLSVESTGREGAITSVFSRGGESDYTLVLIDGVRVNASGGRFDFSRVSAGEIERIEVVRGSQSALYGSDAMGGVVQLFTRRGAASAPPQVTGSIEGGRFHTWRGDVRLLGGARNRVDYQAGVTYRGTDGAFADLLPEKDRYDQTAFDGSAGTVIGRGASVRGGVRYSDARGRAVGPVAYGSRDRGTGYNTKDLAWHLDVAQRVNAMFSHTAQVAYFRSDVTSSDALADPTYDLFAVLAGTPGALFPNGPRLVRFIDQLQFNEVVSGARQLGPDEFVATTTPFGVGDFPFTSATQFRRPAIKYQADVAWKANHVLSAGYEYERERSPLSAGFPIDNHAYFAQQQVGFDNTWFATVGGRFDHNSRYGNTVSPRLALGGYLVPLSSGALSSLKVFFNAGKGIKNPVFDELFGSAFVDGNPELRPERAITIDAGTELTFAAQRYLGRVTYFDNRYRDQVAFRGTSFSPDGLPDYLNIEGSKARGIEIEAGLQRPIGGVTAGAGYALLSTEVTTTVSSNQEFQPGQPLLRRPKHSGTFRLMYETGRLVVNFHGRFVGQRHDAAFLGLTAPVQRGFAASRAVDITVNPGYAALTVSGEYRVRSQAAIFARVDNLANVTYESALGYPGMPRAVVTGVRFNVGGR